MKYAIFTSSEQNFRNCCSEIFSAGIYKGYKTLPMVVWTRRHIILKDNTDITWIDTKYDIQDQLQYKKFDRIHVLDGISKIQLLESVYPSWNPA